MLNSKQDSPRLLLWEGRREQAIRLYKWALYRISRGLQMLVKVDYDGENEMTDFLKKKTADGKDLEGTRLPRGWSRQTPGLWELGP